MDEGSDAPQISRQNLVGESPLTLVLYSQLRHTKSNRRVIDGSTIP